MTSNSEKIEQLKKKLKEYYESRGIIPGEQFCCKNQDKCPGELSRGMQCHIGSRYGEKMRIVVASLDCGNGGADTIKDRIDKVVYDAENKDNKRNPHMRGTFKSLALFFDEQAPNNLVHYMAMINTCKCCSKTSPDHLPEKYYRNCSEYTLSELLVLKPDVILFQGKFAPIGCQDYLSEIESIDDEEVRQNLRLFRYQDILCYAVICIHPAARGRQIQRRNHFYDTILPKIAEYIKNHPVVLTPDGV